MVKNPLANAGDTGSIPGLGGSHTPRATEAMNRNYRVHAATAEASAPQSPGYARQAPLSRTRGRPTCSNRPGVVKYKLKNK